MVGINFDAELSAQFKEWAWHETLRCTECVAALKDGSLPDLNDVDGMLCGF